MRRIFQDDKLARKFSSKSRDVFPSVPEVQMMMSLPVQLRYRGLVAICEIATAISLSGGIMTNEIGPVQL